MDEFENKQPEQVVIHAMQTPVEQITEQMKQPASEDLQQKTEINDSEPILNQKVIETQAEVIKQENEEEKQETVKAIEKAQATNQSIEPLIRSLFEDKTKAEMKAMELEAENKILRDKYENYKKDLENLKYDDNREVLPEESKILYRIEKQFIENPSDFNKELYLKKLAEKLNAMTGIDVFKQIEEVTSKSLNAISSMNDSWRSTSLHNKPVQEEEKKTSFWVRKLPLRWGYW